MPNIIDTTQQVLNDFNDHSRGGMTEVLADEGISERELYEATDLAPEDGYTTIGDAPSFMAFYAGFLAGWRQAKSGC